MFESRIVSEQYARVSPEIISSISQMNSGDHSQAIYLLEEIDNAVEAQKRQMQGQPELVLNELYILHVYICFLISYVSTWQCLGNGKYGDSWQSLQNAIDRFRIVKKFHSDIKSFRQLVFFENQLVNLEKLYPYHIFFSIGAVVDYYECSICGLDIDSMECPHFRGELYYGQMSVAIAKNIAELNHVSLVKHPADKRCVVTYKDDSEAFKLLRFMANLLKEDKLKPIDFGGLIFSKKTFSNPNYIRLGRNEGCFCGSEKKFKHCCIDKEKVMGEHIEIVAKPMSVNEILGFTE